MLGADAATGIPRFVVAIPPGGQLLHATDEELRVGRCSRVRPLLETEGGRHRCWGVRLMKSGIRGRRVRLASVLFLLAGLPSVTVLATAEPASAAPTAALYVTTTGSGSVCSASAPCGSIQTADNTATSGPYNGDSVTINVASGTYMEFDSIDASGLAALAIDGAGASTTAVNASYFHVVFTINGGTVSISNLTVEDGGHELQPPNFGGGIAVFPTASLLLNDTTVSGSKEGIISGAGIVNAGRLTLLDSTVSGNTSERYSGIDNESQFGGPAAVILVNSTVSGNVGGIGNSGTMTLTDSTVSGNTAAGGPGMDNTGTLTIGASIMAANEGGNCEGSSPVSTGYNLTDDGTGAACGFTRPTDVVGSDPDLGPLADNGGPTETMMPMAGSLAIGKIPSAPATTLNGIHVCPRTDQRGVASFGSCTIGAVEVVGASPFRITTVSLPNGTVGAPYSATLQATGGNPPYRWRHLSGRLPQGLRFDPATAVLSGTPTKAGTRSVIFRVWDTKQARKVPINKARATFTIRIDSP
jgi:hypothetical protein